MDFEDRFNALEPYRVNVSSIQDFMQCRFRWWCKWVVNRVPLATAPALDAGKLLHVIFEDHFNTGEPLMESASKRVLEYRKLIPLAHPVAQQGAMRAAQVIEDFIEALPLWEEHFPIDKVLEVEAGFELPDPKDPRILWLGRPDRVVIGQGAIWHWQNRGLAAQMNFGTYTRLAKRHYHEHLYAEALWRKYCRPWVKKAPPRLRYGGTVFNLVRKLKFRTNVGRVNETTKTAEEMFWQGAVSIDVTSPLHDNVMQAMRNHVYDMMETVHAWETEEFIPSPNEKMNGGYSGSSEDPFFKVLIGEIDLFDNNHFKPREDTYANTESTEAA